MYTIKLKIVPKLFYVFYDKSFWVCYYYYSVKQYKMLRMGGIKARFPDSENFRPLESEEYGIPLKPY